jgi:hypothetical protein
VAHDQIFITVGHLRSSCCGAPFLTRGQVCNLLVQFAVTLGPKSCRTHGHILLSQLRLPQTWRARSPYLYPPGTGWPSYTPGTGFPNLEVEVEVNLRPTVSRPMCPGVRRPSGTHDQFFFLLEISFRQLWLCYFVAPSLTRRRICNLLVQLLLGLARAVTLGSKSHITHGHILLSY